MRKMMMIAACMLSVVGLAQTTESLSIADFEITTGEAKDVEVELTTETEYVAFQFDLVLPEGVSIALTDKGKLDVRLGEDMTDDHTLTAQKVSETENHYRFVCFSMTNSSFLETSGTIVNLTIQADADAPIGDNIGTLKSIRFAESSAVEYPFADTTFTITCKENTATSLDDVLPDESEKQIYTLDGRQAKTAQKGVNIVRQGDGTTQKVYVK